jgi:hypothetical protein
MLAACNLLNAIGGTPVLNTPKVVPTYPKPLPMTIGSTGGTEFVVGLRRYSKDLITNTFMVIEEPETPVQIPVGAMALDAEIDDHYRTIGEFYGAVAAAIQEGGQALFAHPRAPQVTHGQVTAITDVKSAVDAIDLIRRQGEGTSAQSPLGPTGEFSHYYRFESLSRGMALVKDAKGSPFFDPASPIVIDNASEVAQTVDNPGQADLSLDPVALQKAQAFDQAYKSMLDQLQEAVSGQPAKLGAARATMGELPDLAFDLMGHHISGGSQAGQLAGPQFMLP